MRSNGGRLVVALAMAGAVLAGGWVAGAGACSCLGGRLPLKEFEGTTVVFIGTLTRWGDPILDDGRHDSSHQVENVFAVRKAFKGAPVDSISIWNSSDGASCGYSFEVGETYLVFADVWNGQLSTDLCRGNLICDAARGWQCREVQLYGAWLERGKYSEESYASLKRLIRAHQSSYKQPVEAPDEPGAAMRLIEELGRSDQIRDRELSAILLGYAAGVPAAPTLLVAAMADSPEVTARATQALGRLALRDSDVRRQLTGLVGSIDVLEARAAINALMEISRLASDSRPAIEARRGDPILGELVERALARIPEAGVGE